MNQDKSLDLIKELEALKTMYIEDRTQSSYNAIILGQIGIGKTSILQTGRMPMVIDSFDPGGSKLADFQPLIAAGKIIPDTRWEKPHVHSFAEWEKVFANRKRSGFFDGIATYVIDSASTFLTSIQRGVSSAKGKPYVEGSSQPDYKIISNTFIDYVMLATALPCDFIMTGHTIMENDTAEGKVFARFNSIPSLQINIPSLFDEIYVLLAERETSTGVERKLLTQSTGKYFARTRIGSRKFLMYEEPDIKKLLTKAGLPTEDK